VSSSFSAIARTSAVLVIPFAILYYSFVANWGTCCVMLLLDCFIWPPSQPESGFTCTANHPVFMRVTMKPTAIHDQLF
jgi:hypothetical protein